MNKTTVIVDPEPRVYLAKDTKGTPDQGIIALKHTNGTDDTTQIQMTLSALFSLRQLIDEAIPKE